MHLNCVSTISRADQLCDFAACHLQLLRTVDNLPQGEAGVAGRVAGDEAEQGREVGGGDG